MSTEHQVVVALTQSEAEYVVLALQQYRRLNVHGMEASKFLLKTVDRIDSALVVAKNYSAPAEIYAPDSTHPVAGLPENPPTKTAGAHYKGSGV